MKFIVRKIFAGFLIFSFFLSACQAASPNLTNPAHLGTGTPTSDVATADGTTSPALQVTATPAQLRSLTVCLGQEPNSLYAFDTQNAAARSVLSAVYDGPIDVFTNGYQPVILESIPSLKNGDMQVNAVNVKRGDRVVDVNGNLVNLSAGMTVFPSGCTEETCAVKYDGSTPLKMDQIVVTFRMLKGLLWSDGTPLTADDSAYAFTVAADPDTPGSKYLTERTASYEATDDTTVQWWGRPGFIDPTYADNFWSPLPKHTWGQIKAVDLAKSDTLKRSALGWGPYVMKEWSAGQFIRLEKNPNYFRAADGFPKFDSLVFRFMKDAEAGISELIAGQCDVLDTSLRLDGQLDLLSQLEKNNEVRTIISTTPIIERLDFGIQQASGTRPNIFSDIRTRQGIAFCLNRPKVVSTVLGGMTVIPDSFVPAKHPLYNDQIAKYPYDPSKGMGLLVAAGWADADQKPATPRTSVGTQGIPPGTPLTVNYWTTSALQRRQVSEILADSLRQCGIGVNLKYYDQNDFYAAGSAGPLFGRQFDLAEYAIGVNGTQPPCGWFIQSEIPTKENNWVGINVSAYNSPDYDVVCTRAMRILPDKPEQKEAFAQAQVLYGNDLPSVPLYQRIKVAATRKDLCNFSLDAFSLNDLWAIEEVDFGPACGS